jgi:DamX protein
MVDELSSRQGQVDKVSHGKIVVQSTLPMALAVAAIVMNSAAVLEAMYPLQEKCATGKNYQQS